MDLYGHLKIENSEVIILFPLISAQKHRLNHIDQMLQMTTQNLHFSSNITFSLYSNLKRKLVNHVNGRD